jgi:hypothetical protein
MSTFTTKVSYNRGKSVRIEGNEQEAVEAQVTTGDTDSGMFPAAGYQRLVEAGLVRVGPGFLVDDLNDYTRCDFIKPMPCETCGKHQNHHCCPYHDEKTGGAPEGKTTSEKCKYCKSHVCEVCNGENHCHHKFTQPFICQLGCKKANGGHCVHELQPCKVVQQHAPQPKLYAQTILIPEGKLIDTKPKSKGIPDSGLVLLRESDVKVEDRGNSVRIMDSVKDRDFTGSLTIADLEHCAKTGEGITAVKQLTFKKTGIKRSRADRERGNQFGALQREPLVRTILSKAWTGRMLWNGSKVLTVPKGYEAREQHMMDTD